MAIIKNVKMIGTIKTNTSALENMPIGLLNIPSFILRLREDPADFTVYPKENPALHCNAG